MARRAKDRTRLTHRRLIDEYGREVALRLMEEFGGHTVPRLTERISQRIERDEAIKRDANEGDSYSDIADRHGVTRQRAEQISVSS